MYFIVPHLQFYIGFTNFTFNRCGPSRAAIMTGRTNVYNANISQKISTFDDDIGYVAGLPIGTQTIAHGFKNYGKSIGVNYTAYYIGKWGLGVRHRQMDRNESLSAGNLRNVNE
jgi:arylsulfatase A-like enzyme